MRRGCFASREKLRTVSFQDGSNLTTLQEECFSEENDPLIQITRSCELAIFQYSHLLNQLPFIWVLNRGQCIEAAHQYTLYHTVYARIFGIKSEPGKCSLYRKSSEIPRMPSEYSIGSGLWYDYNHSVHRIRSFLSVLEERLFCNSEC